MPPFIPSLVLCAGLSLAAFGTQASVTTLSDCASCNGASYTLSYSGSALADDDPLHETYRIMLSIDTAGVAAVVPKAVALDAAAIKVSSSVFAATLISAPGGLGNWSLLAGGVSGQGCNGKGNGFECADWSGSGLGAALGGVLDFVFDLTVANGGLFTAIDAAHVKARFADSKGEKTGAVVSNDITLGSFQAPPPAPPPPGPTTPPTGPTAPTGDWTPPVLPTGLVSPGSPTVATSDVPEPGSLLLAALALTALPALGRRRRR